MNKTDCKEFKKLLEFLAQILRNINIETAGVESALSVPDNDELARNSILSDSVLGGEKIEAYCNENSIKLD